MKTLQLVPTSHRKHPIFIAALLIGLVVGLFVAIPKGARGWVVAAILAMVLWFTWTAKRDQAMTGTVQPVPADYAPRAELVRLPNK